MSAQLGLDRMTESSGSAVPRRSGAQRHETDRGLATGTSIVGPQRQFDAADKIASVEGFRQKAYRTGR